MHGKVKAVLFDLDGTIYRGNEVIPGAKNAIEYCRALGKQVFFVTNNSAKTRKQIHEKLLSMGIECQYDEAITAGYISALYALQKNITNLYVCGTVSLCDEFLEMGIDIVDARSARTLIIGYDPEFNYAKLTEAIRVARHADLIIACNKERVFIGDGAREYPGCGAMVAAVEWCSNRTVDIVLGKPSTMLLEVLAEEKGYNSEGMLMVGDTYESDIVMAKEFGCPSVLIGETAQTDTVAIGSIDYFADVLKMEG